MTFLQLFIFCTIKFKRYFSQPVCILILIRYLGRLPYFDLTIQILSQKCIRFHLKLFLWYNEKYQKSGDKIMERFKVLIVDDEQAIRAGIRNLINWEDSGYGLVGEATNGRDALAKIAHLQPHIVITDLIMPQLNGVELSNIIAKNYPEIQVVVLSSHDDFELVKSSFQNGVLDYILKPTLSPDILLKILNQSAAKIKISQSDVDPKLKLQNELNQYLSGYTSDFKYDQLRTMLIDKPYYMLYSVLSLYKQPQEMRKQIEQYFNIISADCPTLQFLTSQNDIGIVLASELDQEALLELLQAKLSLVNFVEVSPFFTLSCAFDELATLKSKYEHFKAASYNQRFYFKNLGIAQEKELLDYHYSADFDSNTFLRSLVNKDYFTGISKANAYLNDLLLHTVSPIFLKEQTSTIFYNLFNVLENNKHFQADFSKLRMNFIMQLNSCEFSDDYAVLVRETIGSLEESLHTTDNRDELFQNILDYIDEHFHEQITLTLISETFHFSYNYLSSYFSNNYNETFSDYLKNLRLDKAKQLLKTSDLNLSEICEAIGYSDLAYFSKVFKKAIGVTPSKYRRGEY